MSPNNSDSEDRIKDTSSKTNKVDDRELVTEINENDVLSGRGGRINAHSGNVKFRELVREHRGTYLSKETRKLDKVKVAAKLVDIIRNMDPPGRFLKECDTKDGWIDIGDFKAIKKAGQAMREMKESTKGSPPPSSSPPSSSPQLSTKAYLQNAVDALIAGANNEQSQLQQSQLPLSQSQQYHYRAGIPNNEVSTNATNLLLSRLRNEQPQYYPSSQLHQQTLQTALGGLKRTRETMDLDQIFNVNPEVSIFHSSSSLSAQDTLHTQLVASIVGLKRRRLFDQMRNEPSRLPPLEIGLTEGRQLASSSAAPGGAAAGSRDTTIN